MNLNLFLAAMWFVISIGILLIPDLPPDAPINLPPDKRPWAAGLAMLLSGYNVVRWRLTRARTEADDASAQLRRHVQRRHQEPTNPEFDFSNEPKPGEDRPEQR